MSRRVFLARLLLAALFGALLVPAQAQEKFSEPALSDPDSWTVVLLPDLLEIVRRYNIVSVPTLMFFRRGEVLWRESGRVDYEHLVNVLNELEKHEHVLL